MVYGPWLGDSRGLGMDMGGTCTSYEGTVPSTFVDRGAPSSTLRWVDAAEVGGECGLCGPWYHHPFLPTLYVSIYIGTIRTEGSEVDTR